MDNEERKQEIARVEQAARALGEYYDTVHIFVTRHEDNDTGTVNLSTGHGNWFARYGQIKNWITKQEEGSREEVRADNQSDQ